MSDALPVTLDRAKIIAFEAGAIMRRHFGEGLRIRRDTKEDTTPITEADREINAYVIRVVREVAPDIDIVGEEGSSRRQSPWRLIFDPLDGTFPFTWGMPVSAFMLALVRDGRPVMSVVHDPFVGPKGRTYAAERGKGCTLNGQPIRVEASSQKKRPVIGFVSWPGAPLNMLKVCQSLEELGFTCVGLATVGYFDAAVAVGEFSGVVFPGKSLHDSAAGHLLVLEAGGVATNVYGKHLTYDGDHVDGHVFSGDQETHDVLLRAIRLHNPVGGP